MKHFHETQAEFMDLCAMPRYTLKEVIEKNMLTNPTFLHYMKLWMRLIQEEVINELFQTLRELDPPMPALFNNESDRAKIVAKIADDIVDSIYVIDGLSNLFGLPRESIFDEIHRANMTKVHKLPSGQSIVKRRADGKILKPEDWQPPKILPIIEAFVKIP